VAVSRRQNETAQPALVDSPVFDLAHFERQTFGDANLQREIIQLFLAQLNDAQKSLAVPMTSTSWRFLTHTLKGASSAVGALQLAEMAGQWELAGTPQSAAARDGLVQTFDAAMAAFVEATVVFQG
jgi:HPt (histidine-containing phosphotransfer) domain-containing protein